MSKDTTYNGYPNYETWSVALIIDNDSNETIAEAQRICRTQAEYVSQRADALREWVESFPDVAAALESHYLASQLLGAALSEVDWHYLVDNYRRADDGSVAPDLDEYGDEILADDADDDDPPICRACHRTIADLDPTTRYSTNDGPWCQICGFDL